MELIIQESGGTLSFTLHCLLILFFGFVLFNIYFNPKFIEDSGFKSSEVNIMFKGPIGTLVLTFFIVSILLLFDVSGDTTEHNVVQYYFWFSVFRQFSKRKDHFVLYKTSQFLVFRKMFPIWRRQWSTIFLLLASINF